MGTLITLFFVGLAVLVVGGVALALIGVLFSATFGLAGFLLFNVAPVVLVGWLMLKLIQRGGSRRRLSAADREWLDG